MDLIDIIDDDDNLDALELIIFGIPRRIYGRAEYFHSLSELHFFERFRLTKQTVLNILVLIEHELEFVRDINYCVSPINQLLICLRVFATGGHLLSIGDFSGCHKSTVSRIVVRVASSIARLSHRFIKSPTIQEEITDTQTAFFNIAAFPRVVGVVDCTHIKIQSPGGADAEIFRNGKSYFSLNVQAISNVNYEFTNIVARWPGLAHDSTIFNNSRIRAKFETNHFPNCILLGDSGYPCKTYLMTPILNLSTEAERLYNEAHIHTRVRIENIFGIWKRRFPILGYGCRLKLQTVMAVVVATAVLHNMARKNGEGEPPADHNIDQLRLQQLIDDGRIPELPQINIQQPEHGYDIRNEFINNYFGQLN